MCVPGGDNGFVVAAGVGPVVGADKAVVFELGFDGFGFPVFGFPPVYRHAKLTPILG